MNVVRILKPPRELLMTLSSVVSHLITGGACLNSSVGMWSCKHTDDLDENIWGVGSGRSIGVKDSRSTLDFRVTEVFTGLRARTTGSWRGRRQIFFS